MNSNYNPEKPKRELYRDPSRGKICGVCVGVADYFDLEVWVVRIIAVTALIFFGFPIFIAYIVAYFVLEPKAGTAKYDKCVGFRRKKYRHTNTNNSSSEHSENVSATVQQVWKKGRVPGQTLKGLNQKFKLLENRLRSMETYVTSKQFELRKEFQNLSS